MEIKRIEVTNYNGKGYDFVPQKLNAMMAKNGSGKTSLIRAITWGLTGEKPGDEARVTLTLDDDFIIERERKDGKNICRLNGNKVTEKALNEAVEDRTGVDLTKAKLAVSDEVLEAGKPEEILKALLNFAAEKTTIGRLLSKFPSISKEAEEKLKDFFPAEPDTFSFSKLDEAYAKFYAERRVMSSDLKEKVTLYKSFENVTKPARTLDKIQEELIKLQLSEKGAKDAAKRLSDYEKAAAAEKKRLEDMENIKKELTGISFKNYTSAEIQLQNTNRQKAEDGLVKLASEEATLKNNISIFKRTLDNLDKPVCPISNKLVCTTDKTGIKEELSKSVKDNEKMLSDIREKRQTLNDALEAYKKWRTEYDAAFRQYQKKSELVGRYKALKENPVLVPEKPVETGAADVSAKKADLEKEKRNAEDYLKANVLAGEIKESEKKIAVLAEIIDALKDKGAVREALISDYLEVIQDALDEATSRFAPGYKANISADGGIRMSLKTPYNADAYGKETLSGGENLLLRFFLLDILNTLSDMGVMFIDNVEALDGPALDNFLKVIESDEFKDTHDHVFICGVDHADVKDAFIKAGNINML